MPFLRLGYEKTCGFCAGCLLSSPALLALGKPGHVVRQASGGAHVQSTYTDTLRPGNGYLREAGGRPVRTMSLAEAWCLVRDPEPQHLVELLPDY